MAQPAALGAGHPGDAGQKIRTSRVVIRAGWVVGITALLQIGAGLALAILNDLTPRDLFSDYFISQTITILAFAVVGIAIVARRPGNVIGWLFCLASVGAGFNIWVFQYARYTAVTDPGSLPASDIAIWLSLWIWIPATVLVIVTLSLLFPSGRLPSRRWRPVALGVVLAAVLLSLSIAIDPNSSSPITESGNPLVTSGNETLTSAVGIIANGLALGSLGFAVAAPVVRYRRAVGDERLQLKWFAFAIVLVIVAMITPPAVDPRGFTDDPLLSGVLLTFALPLLPISVGIAVLRYRLYDIDLLINRTLVYVALTACIIGVYAFVVGYLSVLFQEGGNLWISLVATGLVAVLFQPLRSWLQLGVNRLLYGERDEPYVVLSRLGQQLEHTLAPDAALDTIVQAVASALKTPHASIWLLDGTTLRLGAVYGAGLRADEIDDPASVKLLRTAPDGITPAEINPPTPFSRAATDYAVTLALPLTHRGELVGALCVAPRHRNDAFSQADRRLLRDLASHAGATTQAVQLTVALRASLEDLRISRERLVVAQEEERRRIQRDLHDGLGPTLASMRPRLEGCLELAQELAPALVSDLERLDELVGQASSDIRRLVYELRPPALDQLGLQTALRQYVERFCRESGIAITFTAGPGIDVAAAAEVALFRIIQEALANIQKHASASQVSVCLDAEDEWVSLEIRDNGTGLPESAQPGTGLGSMRERAEMLGGSLTVANHPDGGVSVVARIPARSQHNDE